MMKWVHNGKVALVWAVLVEIIVHLTFAGGAFLLGAFIGDVALATVFGPLGHLIGAWGLAIFVFGAAFSAFVLGEYARDHVQAYEAASVTDGSYYKAWKELRRIVWGLEIASLLFRVLQAFQEGSNAQAIIVLIFGVLALRYAASQAKVIHASVNRPVQYDMAHAYDETARSVINDVLKYVPDMTMDQKRGFLAGDDSVFTDYEAGLQARQQEKLQPKQREQQHQQHVHDRIGFGEGLMNRLTHRPAKSSTSDPLSFTNARPSNMQANGQGQHSSAGHNGATPH